MPKPPLRLFPVENSEHHSLDLTDETDAGTHTDAGGVSVTLKVILETLADARIKNRSWLLDFDDETIIVSEDLHDVIQAYRQLDDREAA